MDQDEVCDSAALVRDDRVSHPRLGQGRVLRLREDGAVIVWFDSRAKPDTLFPDCLARLGSPVSSVRRELDA